MKKILLAVTIMSVVIVALFTFGAFATYNYLKESKPHQVVQQKIEVLQAQVNQVSNISLLRCWSQLESIFSINHGFNFR